MQRHLRPVEHHQQSGLVGVQPLKQAVQGGEAGLAFEDAIEACAQFRPVTECRVGSDALSLTMSEIRLSEVPQRRSNAEFIQNWWLSATAKMAFAPLVSCARL